MDENYAATLAAGDQQRALNKKTWDAAVERAATLLGTMDETRVWAVISMELANGLGLVGKHPQFAAEMLAHAAIETAKRGDR